MSRGRTIRCYDYVNRPYEDVRDELKRDALAVFQSATKAVASRTQSLAAGTGAQPLRRSAGAGAGPGP